MATPFAKSLLKIAVAQICQNIGWNAVQSTPLELLVDILHRHLLELSKATHSYSNQYGRSEPNLVDLSLAFRSMGIKFQELEEYVSNVEPVPFAHKVAAFPVSNPSNFYFPKQGSKEVAQRPEWIHEYMPLMNPELEEEEPVPAEPCEELKKEGGPMSPGSTSSSEELNPSSPKMATIKKPVDTTDSKKPKVVSEEEGRPMREVASVFMTPSGIITFARDSKLPDSRPPPKIVDSRPPSPDTSSSSESLPSPKISKDLKKDLKKDKVKILKMKKNLVMKSKLKKLMMSKKDGKENSDKISKNSDIFHKKSLKLGDELLRMKSKKKSSKDLDKSSKNRQAIGKIKIAKDVRLKPKDFSLKMPKAKYKPPKSPSRVATFTAFPRSPKSPKALNKLPKMPVKIKPPVEKPPKVFEDLPVKIEPLQHALQVNDFEDEISRDDTPEPRLVIDDEAQARQEKESRLAVLDECIDAVIQRAREEMEIESVESDRNMEACIDAVVKSSVVKKLEPRDVYDFTDSSDASNPPTPKTPEPPSSPVPKVKKEKKSSPELVAKLSPEPVKKKKSKSKKKASKESKASKSIKPDPSPVFIDDSDMSSDEIHSSPSPVPANFANQTSPTSLFTAMTVPKFPALGLNQGPFSPVRSLPSNPFPTPPLFGPPIKSEPLPLNLPMSPQPLCAQSSLANIKTAAEKKCIPPLNLSVGKGPEKKMKIEDEVDKAKPKKKETKKEKSKKKNKDKVKEMVKEEEPPIPICLPPSPRPPTPMALVPPIKEPVPVNIKSPPAKTQTPKPKAEKKGRGKAKGKGKIKEEKEDQDNIPKITFKLGGSGGGGGSSSSGATAGITQPAPTASTKIVIKSSSKGGSQPTSPTPVREPSPPKPPPSPSPPAPLPPAPVVVSPPSPPPHVISPQLAPAISGTRGRHGGRGRGAAKRAPSPPPPPSCTVITETLGTIVDESGNKIWICPACTRPDDGSPMIGCDECDDWYHWVCVGIVVPPKEEESWFCSRCITKRQSPVVKRKRKKHKKDK